MPKELVWTDELIRRFWDYKAKQPDVASEYFTLLVGEGIANFTDLFLDLSGKPVLDFGCGKGFLIQHLLDRGASVWACDNSIVSIDHVNRRYLAEAGWKGASVNNGARIPFEDDSFEVAFCIETIEHVTEERLAPMFRELRRVLSPGGRLLVTTPNEEDLSRSELYCPTCDQVFHRMQHLRSWSASSLGSFLEASGLTITFAQALAFDAFQTDFVKWKPALKTSLRHLYHFFEYQIYKYLIFPQDQMAHLDYLLNRCESKRHLVAIATK